ncbi:Hypothetical predicted protein [Mytilus galloprovincialis]|uniref:DZIP3-like HEPN domain-containing protein n=1 Tax=Mytilus galloprovincialis TaxID=29158 RepID=A0A8B6GXS7_MYTGA|nr:Hypothetical predicted protein [Mytilus galloprovincialis]
MCVTFRIYLYSIRAIYGESKLKNAVNGSSDLEHAEKTIKIIFGERSSACIIYLRDSNIDVNAVLQKIDDIKESIRTGNYQMKDCIELTDIKLGSLILHVTIPLKCFITKEILQKSFQTFLCQFFKAASIQSRSGPNIKVVLAESDLLFAETTNTDDLDYLNEKPSSVLNLNVKVKDTAFHSEFALHREVNRFIFGMYNTIDMHNVPVNGSAREVLMVAANESVENVYTSDDKQDPQLSFPANMSYKEDPRYAQIIVFYCDVAQYIIREFALLTIQKYKYSDWLEFLHQNIHNIYHLWKHNTTCCQCSRDSLRVSNKTQILQQKQINMLLTTDGPANPDHCIGDHEQHIEQNCLSKVSVIPTCSIESIDVSLLVILLRNCEGTKHDYEKSRDILSALIEVRNELSHAPGTELGDEKCQQLWGKLTKAILKLAEISSAETNVSVELVQRQIKECQDRCGTIEQMRKVSCMY